MDCIDLQQQIEEKKYKIDINIIYKEIAINRYCQFKETYKCPKYGRKL